MFAPDVTGMTQPILVSGTDGVGTKLKLAFALNKHDSIGIDCVAMCVNDIICVGAKPLFFLDYIATGKLEPEQIEGVVAGIAEGCRQSGAALVGGETAEMPGFYARGEYDVAGFTVGMVDQPKMIDGKSVKAGDVIIGLASSGVHSNGFSLVRKLFPEDRWNESFGNSTLGETLLTPTKIYVKPVLNVMENHSIHAIAHITGGGFIENIPRAYPDQFQAVIKKGSWPHHNIFKLIQQTSGLDDDAMYNTFNMGIGMVMIVDPGDAEVILADLNSGGEEASIIGEIKTRDGGEAPICFE
jgi:phosphoribosylformylglycinamidine cyclo-ligase